MSEQLSAEEFHQDIALPLLSWLKKFHHTELPSFFTDMIEKDEKLQNKVYNQNGINISIHSLATLANNNAVDRAVVDNTLKLFEKAYSSTNTIFVPSEITSHWQEGNSLNWCSELLRTRVLEHAFVVCDYKKHWSPLHIDFACSTIYYGDSYFNTKPATTINAILSWLSFNDYNTKWKTQKMNIPQQPTSSRDCGVISLNAIERLANIHTRAWTVSTSDEHRLKLFKLLCGIDQVGNPYLG